MVQLIELLNLSLLRIGEPATGKKEARSPELTSERLKLQVKGILSPLQPAGGAPGALVLVWMETDF